MAGIATADRVPVIVEEGWVACLGETRLVRHDRVSCPLRHRLVAIDECLACHFVEALDEERGPSRACGADAAIRRRE